MQFLYLGTLCLTSLIVYNVLNVSFQYAIAMSVVKCNENTVQRRCMHECQTKQVLRVHDIVCFQSLLHEWTHEAQKNNYKIWGARTFRARTVTLAPMNRYAEIQPHLIENVCNEAYTSTLG